MGLITRSWIIGLAVLLVAGASPAWAEDRGAGRYGTITMIRGVECSLIVLDLRTGNSWIARIDRARTKTKWQINNRVIGTSAKRLPGVVRTGEAAIKLLARGPDVLRGGEESQTRWNSQVLTVYY